MGFLNSLKEKIIGETVEETEEAIYPLEDEVDGDEDLDVAGQGETGESLGGAIELKVVKPERYGNVKQIADHLLNHRTVAALLFCVKKGGCFCEEIAYNRSYYHLADCGIDLFHVQ